MSMFSSYSPKWFSKGNFNPEILLSQSGSSLNCTTVMLCPGIVSLANTVWYYNGNTVGSLKWIGTVDNFDLPFRVNNIEVARVQKDGSFQIGGSTIGGGEKLNVQNSTFTTTAQFLNNLSSAGLHYGVYSSVSGGGGGSNIAGYFSSIGGVSNIAGYFDNGDVLLINGGLYINTAVDTSSKVSAKGFGATSATYSLKLYNSVTSSFQVRDDFWIGAGNQANKNLSIGFNSATITDTNNTFIGVGSGQNVTTGASRNTGLGADSLNSLTTGSRNTSVGDSSGNSTNTGFGNTFIGWGAGQGITSNNYCTAIGYKTLTSTYTGVSTAIGGAFGSFDGCLSSLTSGNNTAIGNASGAMMITADGNTLIGFLSMARNTLGNNNSAFGESAGEYALTVASNNVYFGYKSGRFNNDTGNSLGTVGRNRNTFIGSLSGTSSTSDDSVFIGYNSGATETNNNRFILSNNSGVLLYGIFDAVAANQTLDINAGIINVQYLPIGNAGLASGDLYVDTAAQILANADLIVARKV